MERPSLPTAAELKRAEEASAGGANRLFELHCESLLRYEKRLDDAYGDVLKQSGHLRFYRNCSVFCGTFLAAGSLALCAYAIQMHAQLEPLAWVLGPVAGIAGVFVWGYRPKQVNELPVYPSPKSRAEGHQPKSVTVGEIDQSP